MRPFSPLASRQALQRPLPLRRCSAPKVPVDVDIVERVEIVRGAGSSLYGSNAFFGVINLITVRGFDIGGVEVSGPPCRTCSTLRLRMPADPSTARIASRSLAGSSG